MSESKARRQRGIASDKIDRATTAYHIIAVHLGGPSKAADMAGLSVHTVYGWLLRGRVPAGQQQNLSERAEAAGVPFPAEWYINAPEPAAEAA